MGFFAARHRARADSASVAVDPARERVLDEIMRINRSASRAFLDTFDRASLERYLDHLLAAQEPRGAGAVWIRPGETPAIVARIEV